MARRKKRRLSPRFYMVLVIALAVVVGVVLIAKKISEPDTGEDPDATPTPVPTTTPAPTNTPKPPLPAEVSVVRAEAANPSAFGFSTELQEDGNKTSSYSRSVPITFGRGTEYTQLQGVTTFAGNNYRNGFSYGTATVSEKRLKLAWEKPVGALGTWTGTGWTGQPLIVKWPAEVRPMLGIGDGYKQNENFVEVIYPAMDGNIYFYDLESGQPSRNPINNGVVNKGTACLDPRGYPLLFVGQGIPVQNDKGNNQAYVRVYNLVTNEVIAAFGGYDYFSDRDWQAFDSSPLLVDDTLVFAGENGVLYSSKLNVTYDNATGTLTINPERLVKYRYEGSGYSAKDKEGARWYGFESSPAAFRNYVFLTDNGGRLQCVNVNNLRLQYVTDLKDESDSTPVIEEDFDDNTIYLYSGSQTSIFDSALGEGYGYTYHRRINGLTGAIMWEKQWITSIGDASASGGTVATPVSGQGNIESLVIFSVSQAALTKSAPTASAPVPTLGPDETPAPTPEPVYDDGTGYTLGGRIVAYNKKTGDVAWTIEQEADYWSSPVIIYDEHYRGYLVQCDRSGHMKLYDALTGTFLYDLDLGSRIDSTPAAFGNLLVVGTRGKGGSGEAAKIVCIKIV